METRKEHGFLRSVNNKIKWFFDELKKDSIGENPSKPIDCCHPPIPRKAVGKPKN